MTTKDDVLAARKVCELLDDAAYSAHDRYREVATAFLEESGWTKDIVDNVQMWRRAPLSSSMRFRDAIAIAIDQSANH